jgi:hypothetical protein
MIMPSDKEYTQTKRIILGIEKIKPEFVPLAKWIDKKYGVKTINIIYDTLYENKPRLQICFEFDFEKNKFVNQGVTYYDKVKQKEIADKFKEIIEQQGLSEKSNSLFTFFKSKKNIQYQTENLFVIYGAFEPIAKIESTQKITKEISDKFITELNNLDIWTISIGFTIPTFFMFTDNKVKEYDKPEIKKKWADKYFELVKPFDQFNYIKREDIQVFIDSKENFDNNYESNWYYYYK